MEKVLIGNGGHAREVMVQMGVKLERFVDDQYIDEETSPLSKFDPNEHIAMIAIANPKDRFDMLQKLPRETQFFTFIHPTALVMDSIEIGEGSFIGAYSILTTNIKIGSHSILNRGIQIGHDCRIGSFFSAMPGAIVSGNAIIGTNVYMGNNSSIREKITVSSNTIIGANAAVVKHIITGGTYVGVPAKIKK